MMEVTKCYSQYPAVDAFCRDRAAAGDPVSPDLIPYLERVVRLFKAGRGDRLCELLGIDLDSGAE